MEKQRAMSEKRFFAFLGLLMPAELAFRQRLHLVLLIPILSALSLWSSITLVPFFPIGSGPGFRIFLEVQTSLELKRWQLKIMRLRRGLSRIFHLNQGQNSLTWRGLG